MMLDALEVATVRVEMGFPAGLIQKQYGLLMGSLISQGQPVRAKTQAPAIEWDAFTY